MAQPTFHCREATLLVGHRDTPRWAFPSGPIPIPVAATATFSAN